MKYSEILNQPNLDQACVDFIETTFGEGSTFIYPGLLVRTIFAVANQYPESLYTAEMAGLYSLIPQPQ